MDGMMDFGLVGNARNDQSSSSGSDTDILDDENDARVPTHNLDEGPFASPQSKRPQQDSGAEGFHSFLGLTPQSEVPDASGSDDSGHNTSNASEEDDDSYDGQPFHQAAYDPLLTMGGSTRPPLSRSGESPSTPMSPEEEHVWFGSTAISERQITDAGTIKPGPSAHADGDIRKASSTKTSHSVGTVRGICSLSSLFGMNDATEPPFQHMQTSDSSPVGAGSPRISSSVAQRPGKASVLAGDTVSRRFGVVTTSSSDNSSFDPMAVHDVLMAAPSQQGSGTEGGSNSMAAVSARADMDFDDEDKSESTWAEEATVSSEKSSQESEDDYHSGIRNENNGSVEPVADQTWEGFVTQASQREPLVVTTKLQLGSRVTSLSTPVKRTQGTRRLLESCADGFITCVEDLVNLTDQSNDRNRFEVKFSISSMDAEPQDQPQQISPSGSQKEYGSGVSGVKQTTIDGWLQSMHQSVSPEHSMAKLTMRGDENPQAAICRASNTRQLCLQHMGLQQLPESSVNLKGLIQVNLNNNKISSTSMPSHIPMWHSLQFLDISHNPMGQIPHFVQCLVHLESLVARNCNLSRIPVWLCESVSLTELNLSRNRLSSIPQGISKLAKLQGLNCSHNMLERLEATVADLPKLESLELAYNHIRSLPPKIGNMLSLSSLDLRFNSLTSIPASLAKVSRLAKSEQLRLDGNSGLSIEIRQRLDQGISHLFSFLQAFDLTASERNALGLGADDSLNEKEAVAKELSSRIQWRKGKVLGQGAFGIVYLALNELDGSLMAVKQVRLKKSSGEDHISLEREIRFMKALQHPNLVKYIATNLNSDGITVDIFVEFIAGGSIADLIEKFGPLSESATRSYTQQLLSGIGYLHKHEIVHRDIKGGNLMLTERGQVKVGDFGLSAESLASSRDDDQVSKIKVGGSGIATIAGTVPWMAPETVRSAQLDHKADVWAIGCTVLEMMTGNSPWPSMTNLESIMFQLSQGGSPPIPDSFSPPLKDFVSLCFKSNVKDRPSVEQLLLHPWITSSEV